MRSTGGNIGKVNANIGKITFDILDKFNIPYDELYLENHMLMFILMI